MIRSGIRQAVHVSGLREMRMNTKFCLEKETNGKEERAIKKLISEE
jgi:hypothetical protein